MKFRVGFRFLAPMSVAIILAAPALARADDGSCVTCHDKNISQQFSASVHARAGVTCVGCHGGDAGASDKSAHATADFQRPATKKEIAEKCASCHSDVRKMNPYGLPTDQLERYKTSKHGEQLFTAGDSKVAVCTDCHGVHDIETAKSPQSSTYPTHIPDTCGKCHSNESLMSQYGLPSDVVAQYKAGYHAVMLFEKGDLSAPTCITCHGNHGATPPSVANVGEVCGKCHGRQRELFEQSPHADAAHNGVFNECVDCHGNHAIKKASPQLFAEVCVRCHEGDERPIAVRDSMVMMITSAQAECDSAAAELKNAASHGMDTEDQQVIVQEAKTSATQLEALQHGLRPSVVVSNYTHAKESAGTVLAAVNDHEKVQRWKRRALIPVWAFLGIMAFAFYRKHEQVIKEDRHE